MVQSIKGKGGQIAISWPAFPKAVKRILGHDVKKLIETAHKELECLLEYQNSLIKFADGALSGSDLRLVKNAGANAILIWRERGNSRTRYAEIEASVINRLISIDMRKTFAKIERERLITNFMIRSHSFVLEQGTNYISGLRRQTQIIK